MNFASRADYGGQSGSMHSICRICELPVIFRFIVRRQNSPDPHEADAKFFDPDSLVFSYQIVGTWPAPDGTKKIKDLPPNVASAFDEAEESLIAGRVSAAAVMYRKAIERTVKAIHPDGKGLLNDRIRQFEREDRVPPAMIDLMDMVKFLGNDGAHDDVDPTKEDVERGRDFARLFLTYVWELPARIEEAKAAKEAKAARKAGK